MALETLKITMVAGATMGIVLLALNAVNGATQFTTVTRTTQPVATAMSARLAAPVQAQQHAPLAAQSAINDQEPAQSTTFQVSSTFCMVAAGASALFALLAKVIASKKTDLLLPEAGKWATAAIELEEDYPGPGSPDEEYTIKVVWDNKEHDIRIKGDQSILMACESAGLTVPYMCRHGVCLECTAQITEGIEKARKDSQCHNAENIRAGYVCTCSTYAGGDGLKLIMGMKDEAYKAQFGKFEEEEREREKRKKGPFGF